MLNEIHHIAIICSDYKISKDFYVNKLGFTIIAEIYREDRQSYKLDLKIGDSGQQIELFSFPNPPKRLGRPASNEACGLRHLAFKVENIQEIVKTLESKDIIYETVRTDNNTGKKFTFFQDPDGLPLEIYEV